MAKKTRPTKEDQINVFKGPRPLSDIRQEYGRLCAEAGEAQYKMKAAEWQLHVLNERISKVQTEFTEAQAREANDKTPEATPSEVATIEPN